MIIVHKYGGSSVATTEKIMNIAKYLGKIKDKKNDVVVVVSAMGKTTDTLIKLAHEITGDPDKREMDRLMSTGEQQTIALLSIALQSLGYDAISLTGRQAGIRTSGHHTKNRIESIDEKKIKKHLEEGKIVIIAGFQGVNENGDVATLGRGGSDTSAVALAAALNGKCEIYTDVDGVYSVDPRIYPEAKKISYISYDEMMELAFLGAGVMEPRAVELGKKYGVEIYVGKSLGEKNGTVITAKEKIMEEKVITGISVNEDILMVNIEEIPTYAKNVYAILEQAVKFGVNIGVISQNDVSSEHGSFAFTCPQSDKASLEKISEILKEKFERISVIINPYVTKVSIVGIGLISNIGIAARVFKVLADNNISFHQVATSEISIGLIVDEVMGKKVAELLAKEFNV
ncbi:aspartate kinase [Pseudoleptotrichia goodfellowii]|uniref:Aspartokinase n=1 Tax=Pseudoleptotrichia goodfellowii F0264 TaxID=596323 RepID=D0GLI3_9FUSO|nr:aspartate kinase [Pseudoleptotrichia goodfellowii]EEY35061.1 amino acid kinase family [Pseudoleptotrichia goodfellowii F0264]MBF4805287.1 aspartate kinase [Pseudoleptotrichia goodfellowii]